MSALTTALLDQGIARLADGFETRHQELSELDGRIGDGDLGITLLKAFRELDQSRAGLPEDLGRAFASCAGSVTKASSSSFGTLFAAALFAVGKSLKGRTSAEWSELPDLIGIAIEAMSVRGKARLGDKTVLDALAAAQTATKHHCDPMAMLADARIAVGAAVTDFADKPNRVGRARIFGDKTVGIPDPGMSAVKVMVEVLGT